MKIFRVLGLGLAIIILRSLVPDIFHAIEQTLLTFFGALQGVLSYSGDTLVNGNLVSSVSAINLLPFE